MKPFSCLLLALVCTGLTSRAQVRLKALQVAALSLGLFFSQTLFSQVVEIPDPELRAAIRNALDKPTGDITVEDMEGLTELDAGIMKRRSNSDLPIRNLNGIEVAKNLRVLNLSGWFGTGRTGIELEDFAPLAGLQELVELDLSANQLTSLILPEGLSNLTTLDLRYNQLSDSSFLEGLSNLTWLNLVNNQLASLTLPEGLSSLTYLNLSGNPLTSLTLPEGLSSLTTLSLAGNQLTSLTLPAGLSSLTTLHLRGSNQLTSLTLPADLSSLTTLYVSYSQLTSLTLPVGLSSLTTLYVRPSQLTSLTLPAGFDLENLNLVGFEKSDVTFYGITISITRVGDKVQVTWTQGVLQATDALGAAWTDLQGATSPREIDPTEPWQYFRVKPE